MVEQETPNIVHSQRRVWRPDPQQRVWFATGGSRDDRLEVQADEIALVTHDDKALEDRVEVRFAVELALYEAIEGRRWFHIPVGFTGKVGLSFRSVEPIQFEVTFAPPSRGGFPMAGLFVGTRSADEKLAQLVAPFVNPDLERIHNNPLLYEVVRVSQMDADGSGVGFDRAMIQTWEDNQFHPSR